MGVEKENPITISLDGSSLTIEKLVAIARHGEKVGPAPAALEPGLGGVRAYRLDLRKPERTATPLLVVSPNGKS